MHRVCVAHRDQIVAAAGPGKKDYTGKTIHRELLEAIEDRRTILATDAEPDFCQITEDETEVFSEAAATILAKVTQSEWCFYCPVTQNAYLVTLSKKYAAQTFYQDGRWNPDSKILGDNAEKP